MALRGDRINAVGSSLFSVGAFGLTTAANYALSGLVAWGIAIEFIAGGVLGGLIGIRAARRLADRKRALSIDFACTTFTVAAYILLRSALAG